MSDLSYLVKVVGFYTQEDISSLIKISETRAKKSVLEFMYEEMFGEEFLLKSQQNTDETNSQNLVLSQANEQIKSFVKQGGLNTYLRVQLKTHFLANQKKKSSTEDGDDDEEKVKEEKVAGGELLGILVDKFQK